MRDRGAQLNRTFIDVQKNDSRYDHLSCKSLLNRMYIIVNFFFLATFLLSRFLITIKGQIQINLFS